MPKGAGLAPAGLSPAGFGAVDQAQAPSRVLLPDPAAGLSSTGRLIQWNTGDYVVTSDGRVEGMSTAQQLVLLALASAVQKFSQLGTKGSSDAQFARKVAGVVNAVLAPIVKQGIIQFVGLTTQSAPGHPDGAAISVVWRDLTQPFAATGAGGNAPVEHVTPLPINS